MPHPANEARAAHPGASPDPSDRSHVQIAVALVAWLASAGVFLVLAPMSGTLGSSALVVMLLLVVPGLLVAMALRIQPGDSPWSLLALSVGIGSGVCIPVAGATRAVGLSLEHAATLLLAIETIPLAIVVRRWRAAAIGTPRSPLPGYGGRGRAAWLADACALGVALALGFVFVRWVSTDIRSGDLWYYLSYISWMVYEPISPYVPHSVDPEELNPRLASSAFLAFEALVTRLLRIDTAPLDVFWRLLPAVFIPLSLLSLYGLGAALTRSAATRAGVALAQGAIALATLPYIAERASSGVRWTGSVLFYRISQDKVFLATILVPIAALAAAQLLRGDDRGARGELRWAAALFAIGAAAVATHPLGLPFVAIATVPFALLHALTQRGPGSGRRLLMLGLVLMPLIAWPMLQTAQEGAPRTLADDAGFERREHLTRDSLRIVSRKQNRFTAHPGLLAHPLIWTGIGCGLSLGAFALRRDPRERGDRASTEADPASGRTPRFEGVIGARFVFALTAAVLVMLYVPGVPPLAGQIVTPYLLWRFTWLLPLALSIALALEAAGFLVKRVAAGRAWARHAAPASVVLLVVSLTLGSGLPGDLRRAADLRGTLQPFPFELPTARRIAERIAERVGPAQQVLLDPFLQTLALAYTPRVKTTYWRRGSNPVLYQRVVDFYTARSIQPAQLALLREFGIRWVAVRKRLPIFEDMLRRTQIFEPVEQIESVTLFRLRDPDGASVDPLSDRGFDTVRLRQQQAGHEPGRDSIRAGPERVPGDR